MHEWIDGLVRAASDRRPGVSEDELRRLEADLGFTLPEDLKALYAAMDGGDLPGEVTLYGLRAAADATGVLEQTLAALSGLPMRGIVRFGLRGGGEHLFAATRNELEPFTAGLGAPEWLAQVPMDFWIYGVKNADAGTLRLFRGLEQLLAALVPQGQGFGENTFVRALSAVQDAIGEVQQQLPLGLAQGEGKPMRSAGAARKQASTAAKKPASAKKQRRSARKPAPSGKKPAAAAKKSAVGASRRAAAKGKGKAPARKVAARRAPAKAARKPVSKKKAATKRGAAKKRR